MDSIKRLNEPHDKADEIRQTNRLYLMAQKDKSDADFETNHVYIAAGTLALSVAFLEKLAPIDKAICIWIIIIAWGLLIISLLVNFISHQVASQFTEKQISLNDKTNDTEKVNALMQENNKTIRMINWFSVGSLIAGIIFLVVYCSINAFHMSKAAKEFETKILPSGGDEINKGRTSVPLQSPTPAHPINQPPPPPPPPDTTKK